MTNTLLQWGPQVRLYPPTPPHPQPSLVLGVKFHFIIIIIIIIIRELKELNKAVKEQFGVLKCLT